MGGRPSKGTKADGRLKENGGGKKATPIPAPKKTGKSGGSK